MKYLPALTLTFFFFSCGPVDTSDPDEMTTESELPTQKADQKADSIRVPILENGPSTKPQTPKPRACGGRLPVCPTGEYCDYNDDGPLCDYLGGYGVCAPSPKECNVRPTPVCGCDNQTYATGCDANLAGISVESYGACEPAVQICGGRKPACPNGEFCNYDDSGAACGFADGEGVCEASPTSCPKNLAPVCGCDGTTYDNTCFANLAGADVQFLGDCNPKQICGGRTPACPADEFCNYEGSVNACGPSDFGVCEPRPDVCAKILAPVCGCNYTTYGNLCLANLAGVDAQYSGACRR